jgi:hypothetical protein
MLEPEDRVVLADGVVLRDGVLVDAVSRVSWPVNASGAFVLERSGRPLGEVAGDVAATFSLPAEKARTDVLAFAWRLNRLALANVERRASWWRHALGWLRLAVRLLPAGAIPPATARRRRLDTRTVVRALADATAAAASRGMALAFAAAVAVGHIGVVAGRPTLLLPIVVGLAAGGAVVLHESAHAAALVGVPSALVVQGRRIFVLHAPAGVGRRALVALAGPLLVATVGVLVIAVAVGVGVPMLAAAGGSAAVHALGLTVLAPDGRTACGL